MLSGKTLKGLGSFEFGFMIDRIKCPCAFITAEDLLMAGNSDMMWRIANSWMPWMKEEAIKRMGQFDRGEIEATTEQWMRWEGLSLWKAESNLGIDQPASE